MKKPRYKIVKHQKLSDVWYEIEYIYYIWKWSFSTPMIEYNMFGDSDVITFTTELAAEEHINNIINGYYEHKKTTIKII